MFECQHGLAPAVLHCRQLLRRTFLVPGRSSLRFAAQGDNVVRTYNAIVLIEIFCCGWSQYSWNVFTG